MIADGFRGAPTLFLFPQDPPKIILQRGGESGRQAASGGCWRFLTRSEAPAGERLPTRHAPSRTVTRRRRAANGPSRAPICAAPSIGDAGLMISPGRLCARRFATGGASRRHATRASARARTAQPQPPPTRAPPSASPRHAWPSYDGSHTDTGTDTDTRWQCRRSVRRNATQQDAAAAHAARTCVRPVLCAAPPPTRCLAPSPTAQKPRERIVTERAARPAASDHRVSRSTMAYKPT